MRLNKFYLRKENVRYRLDHDDEQQQYVDGVFVPPIDSGCRKDIEATAAAESPLEQGCS